MAIKSGKEAEMEVKKVDGLVEMFSITKLENSIKLAAKDAKLPANKINSLVKETSKYVVSSLKGNSVSAGAIRKSVLAYLDKNAKEVSKTWRNFEKKNK